MAETTLRRTLPEAYRIGPGGGSYLGLVGTGAGATYAVAYTGGEWTEELGSTSAFDALDLVWPPVFAAGRYVLAQPDFQTLAVWDLETGDVDTYTPPAGWSVLGAAILSGTVYWVERETVEHGSGTYAYDVRLRSSGYDLTLPSTLCTRSVSVLGGQSTDSPLGTGAVLAVMFNATAAIASWSWVDQFGVNQGVVRVRLEYGGDSEQADVADAIDELGVPQAAADSVLANRSGVLDGSVLLAFPDDVEGELTSLWPANEAYGLSPSNAGLSLDGTEAVVYGFDEEDGATLVRAPVASAPSTPTERATVSQYGELDVPKFLYPRD